jgi:hypothetical protein
LNEKLSLNTTLSEWIVQHENHKHFKQWFHCVSALLRWSFRPSVLHGRNGSITFISREREREEVLTGEEWF